MKNNFEQRMALKSDDDLMLYMDDAERYTPEAVQAAIAELQKRGKHFEAEEIESINNRVKIRQQELGLQDSEETFITEDGSPAYLYSKSTIFAFTILFSLIAGAILLAINFKDKVAKRVLIVAVIGYYLLIGFIIQFIPLKHNLGVTLIINGIGFLLMMQFFWNPLIGKNMEYRSKPIWTPLIISILIYIPLYFFAHWAQSL